MLGVARAASDQPWRAVAGIPGYPVSAVVTFDLFCVPLLRAWQALHDEHAVSLHICVAAALRRGITDEQEARQLSLPAHNLQPGFTLSGLGALAEAALTCDRMVQF